MLLINTGFFGGGAERAGRELFLGLPAFGVETRMLVGWPQEELPAGVEVMPRPWERRLAALEAAPFLFDGRLRGSIRALDAIKPGDFDVVHLHVLHSGCASIKAVRRLSERLPMVWTFHDEWATNGGNACPLDGLIDKRRLKSLTVGLSRHIPYHPYHENPRWRALRAFLKRWMPRPREIIVPSKHIVRVTERGGLFPGVPVHRVPYAVSMIDNAANTTPRDEAKRSLGLAMDRKTVLMAAANLRDVHKGVEFGLRAIESVGKRQPVQALLLGRNAETYAARLAPTPVKAMFVTDDAVLARAYRAADVTLLPSLVESFSLVAAESMACGTPVACFRIGGPSEIVGETGGGLVAPPFDVDALSANLATLLGNDQLARESGERGRAWVRANCDRANYFKRIVEIYESARRAGAASFK